MGRTNVQERERSACAPGTLDKLRLSGQRRPSPPCRLRCLHVFASPAFPGNPLSARPGVRGSLGPRAASSPHKLRAHRSRTRLRPKPAMDSAALQERLQTASVEYQKIQADLTIAVDARQKLDAQLSENEIVKKVRPRVYTRLLIHDLMPSWRCMLVGVRVVERGEHDL